MGSRATWFFSARILVTWPTVIFSSMSSDLADPSAVNTLTKSFLTDASLIFSMASLIFSALILASSLFPLALAPLTPVGEWVLLETPLEEEFFE